jgi:hypothetical protein
VRVPRYRRVRTLRRRRLLGLLAASLLVAGCIELRFDFQRVPPEAAFAAIQPGLTSRAEVLAALGPPEEVRQPALGEEMRRSDPRRLRLLAAGEVFDDGAWTWAAERRSERIVGLLPVGLVLFRVWDSRSLERRWRIEFDAEGLVRSVARVDELEGE